MSLVGGLVAMGLFWITVGATSVAPMSFDWWLIVAGCMSIGVAINVTIHYLRKTIDV